MDQKKAKKIEKIINDLPYNIKAEVLITELLENGYLSDDFEIDNTGSFFRPFRKDIANQKVIEYKQDEFILSLLLSRNGIYDILPEGLMHKQDIVTEKKTSAKTFISTYHSRKSEENEARKFFKPIENEMFHQMVVLERTEKELLFAKRVRFFNFLVNFWNINTSLRLIHQEALLYILPYFHIIAGNFELICSCLEYFLKIDVNHQIEYKQYMDTGQSAKLGKNNKLGGNFVAGNKTALIPKVIFKLGPVNSSQIDEYINNGEIAKFIKVFFEYVIPIEFSYELKWNTTVSTTTDVKKSHFGKMGYTLKL